jgi:hypothetical protein
MDFLYEFAGAIFEDVLEVSLSQERLVQALLLERRLLVKDIVEDSSIVCGKGREVICQHHNVT